MVDAVAKAEAAVAPGEERLARAAANSLAKLMSYKDEYEVARLHAASTKAMAEALFQAEPGRRLRIRHHLSPPLLTRPGPDGRPRKMRFGPWIGVLLRLLKHGKHLRGSPVDPFGWTEERRLERALITRFEKDLRLIARRLSASNRQTAVELAEAPLAIKGFGAVKVKAAEAAARRRAALMERFLRA